MVNRIETLNLRAELCLRIAYSAFAYIVLKQGFSRANMPNASGLRGVARGPRRVLLESLNRLITPHMLIGGMLSWLLQN